MPRQLVLLGLVGLLALGCQGKGGDDDHDGNEMKVSMSDVPQAVSASFQQKHPGATVKEIEKETHADGTAHYEFEFTAPDGKAQEVELDDKGAVVAEDKD